ncbi:hypothetical protein E1263_11835 [Kribbella antibiotica]|uniref:Uncharacterized protein n=1 Tax=Kribbella antibiotica TaxID=190195 RepID=A0A4R4ZTE3_9ACTN|nr:hypothetical protein [Kribbella antibiotica]TDD60302.1 hypothetical protein E1263_11835 [Kribbella antibiotica]
MKARVLKALVGVAVTLSGLLVASPAHAVSTSVTSPDGGAYGRVIVGANGNYTFNAEDKSCDARGAVLHQRTFEGAWGRTVSDGSCHGDGVYLGPFTGGHGVQIEFYVCNTNTRTGYKSCSAKKRVTT